MRWQGWTFRVGFNYREGLVLHDLKFQSRSVCRRASLVEMTVPYADPRPPYQSKNAGVETSKLHPGCFYAKTFDKTGQTSKLHACSSDVSTLPLWHAHVCRELARRPVVGTDKAEVRERSGCIISGKCAGDVSDYGLGFCAQSLELCADCKGDITYFDAVLADSAGEPYTVKKAVCMHEEDAGEHYSVSLVPACYPIV